MGAPAPVYPQAGYAPVAYHQPPSNPMGIAGMVCGIVGLVFCWVPYFGLIVAIIGLVLSIVGIIQANKTGASKAMAITGLVCSIVAVAIWVIIFAIVGAIFASL